MDPQNDPRVFRRGTGYSSEVATNPGEARLVVYRVFESLAAMPSVQSASLRLSGDAPGSIRFWFAPEWSSTSAGGAGPCLPATLLQAGDDGWRLATDSSGNFLQILALET